jgi:hypothetical protein
LVDKSVLVAFGETGFLIATACTTLFLIGGHFGLHRPAGIFYPSTFRGNAVGTSVAKVESVAGHYIAGVILATSLPVRNISAVLAIYRAVFVVHPDHREHAHPDLETAALGCG